MAEMSFADKLAAIYAAKLAIREAINKKGVSVTNDTPFAEYAAKILLIEGSGGGTVGGDGIISISRLSDGVDIGYILPQYVNISELAALLSDLSGEDIFAVAYPPTNGFALSDDATSTSISTPNEIVGVVFTLFAIAESFRPSTAQRYSYNPDWVQFMPNGAYLYDKIIKVTGSLEATTTNGAYFSLPLPHRQYYGNLNSLTARLEVQANDN